MSNLALLWGCFWRLVVLGGAITGVTLLLLAIVGVAAGSFDEEQDA